MSVKYYGKMWIATKDDLKNVLLKEKVTQKLKPTKERMIAHRILASLYAKYVILCNNLGDIYDQTCQVQKRKVVEEILVSTTNRMFELEKQVKEIEMSEFIYLDQTLIEQKFIPQDVKLLKPFYFPKKREKHIQDLIDGVRPTIPPTEEEILEKQRQFAMKPKYIQMIKELTPEELEAKRIKQKFIDAVNLIKKHEKARQSRILLLNIRMHPEIFSPKPRPSLDVKYDFYHKKDQTMLIKITRTVYRTKSKEIFKEDVKKNSNLEDESAKKKLEEIVQLFKRKEDSASRIQKAWRKLIEKNKDVEKRKKRLLLLGMIDERKWDFSKEKEDESARQKQSSKKDAFDAAFIQAMKDEKTKILKLRTPWIMEDITDHIRAWFREWYDSVLKFDRYPEEFEGGTILVVRGETLTIPEYVEIIRKQNEDKLKSDEEKAKEAQEKIDRKEKEKGKRKKERELKKKILEDKKRLEKKQGKTWDFTEPEFITKDLINLDQTLQEYERNWYFIEELKNIHELPYMEWITLDAYSEVHQELRKIVDELMRIEFEVLRMSLALDELKPYKPQKKKKEKKKKGKKKKEDALSDEELHKLYDELLESGIIRHYTRRKIDDYISDFNYAAFELRNIYEKDPIHFMGDVKSLIRSYILGMGPLKLYKPKSICIAGPQQSGKKFLLEAICSETDAVLFDLSPNKIVKFNDMKYFVKMITNISRILQPSILFIDGAHKPFYKKIPINEIELNPTKLGIVLPKLVKAIKADEQIMLIATTNEPWNSRLAKMKKCYEKIVLIPKSDYGSVLLTWRTSCLNKIGVPRTIDLSALSMVTKGYSTGQILENVDCILNLRRRMKLFQNPLRSEELLEGLLKVPYYSQTDEKFVKWYSQIDKLAKLKKEKEKEKEKLNPK